MKKGCKELRLSFLLSVKREGEGGKVPKDVLQMPPVLQFSAGTTSTIGLAAFFSFFFSLGQTGRI